MHSNWGSFWSAWAVSVARLPWPNINTIRIRREELPHHLNIVTWSSPTRSLTTPQHQTNVFYCNNLIVNKLWLQILNLIRNRAYRWLMLLRKWCGFQSWSRMSQSWYHLTCNLHSNNTCRWCDNHIIKVIRATHHWDLTNHYLLVIPWLRAISSQFCITWISTRSKWR